MERSKPENIKITRGMMLCIRGMNIKLNMLPILASDPLEDAAAKKKNMIINNAFLDFSAARNINITIVVPKYKTL